MRNFFRNMLRLQPLPFDGICSAAKPARWLPLFLVGMTRGSVHLGWKSGQPSRVENRGSAGPRIHARAAGAHSCKDPTLVGINAGPSD